MKRWIHCNYEKLLVLGALLLVLVSWYEKPCIPSQSDIHINHELQLHQHSIATTKSMMSVVHNMCVSEFHRITTNMTDLISNLQDEDFERSIAHVRNRYRLAKFANKLLQSSSSLQSINSTQSISNNPVTVLVCGGSISLGHGVNPAKARYSDLLEVWLNTAYPVTNSPTTTNLDDDNTRHRVYNRGSHGADICAMAKRMNYFNVPRKPDLFILEFGVNDYQGQDHVVHVDHKTDVFFDGFQRLAECAETVVYRILTDYPDAAIIFLEFQTGVPHRKTAQLLHVGVAQYYQIPVISYADTIIPEYFRLLETLKPYDYHLPNAMVSQIENEFPFPHGCSPCRLDDITEQFRRHGCSSLCQLMKWSDLIPWENKCVLPPEMDYCFVPFFAHDEVHPSVTGHRIARDLIINMIAQVSLESCQGRTFKPHLLPVNGGWIAAASGSKKSYGDELRARSDFVLVRDTMSIFADTEELSSNDHTTGFELKHDKLYRRGWIAENPLGHESISFDIDLPTSRCYAVFISVLKSYNTVGTFTVSVTDRNENRSTDPTDIDCLWEPRISIPVDIQVTSDDQPQCTGSCTITIMTKPETPGRGGNLIKIMSLSARRCLDS